MHSPKQIHPTSFDSKGYGVESTLSANPHVQPAEAGRTSEQIQAEIRETLGFIPVFFEPAYENSNILENLWQQTLVAYINNPLSSLFKEKLSAYLSRYCAVPYCMICHSCSLYSLGVQAKEVLTLLELPLPTEIEIEEHLKAIASQPDLLTALSEPNSKFEQSLLYCSIFISLENDYADYCRSELRRLISFLNYQHIVTFVAYVKMCHVWMEAHPEVMYATDKRVQDALPSLLAAEPSLADFFQDYRERVKRERQNWTQRLGTLAERKRAEEKLQQAYNELEIKVETRTAELRKANQQLQAEIIGRKRVEAALRESEERYRSVVTAMHEGVMLQDITGKIIACNASAENILGLTAEQMMGRTSVDRNWCAIYENGSPFPGELHPAMITLNTGKSCSNVTMGIHKPNGQLIWILINSEPLFRAEETKPYGVVTSFSDITERKQAEETLRKLSSAFEQTADNVIITNKDGVIEYVNSAFEQLTGYTQIEAIGKTPKILKSGKHDPSFYVQLWETLLSGKVFRAVFINSKKDGTLFHEEKSITPVKDQQGNITHFVSAGKDITERKQVEEKLIRIGKAVESSSDAIGMADVTGTSIYHNKAFLELLEYTVEELNAAGGPRVLFADSEVGREVFETIERGDSWSGEVEMRSRNGHPVTVFLRADAIKDDHGQILGLVGVHTNISQQKQAEQQIKASLQEKEVLLREIHHRVKNNLQVISSLLSIQSRYVESQEVLDIFKDSQNRIQSMALIHERLYKSKDLIRIDFSEYLKKLSTNLLCSYKKSTDSIQLRIESTDILLSINTAIPCGLIINELVSNSLKYAFLEKHEGEIYINISIDSYKNYTLTVKDNGIGLPATIDIENVKSLGLRLVTTLVEQLHGNIEIDKCNGTTFKIVFKETI